MNGFPADVRALYQDVILQRSRAPAHAHRPARVDACGTGDNPMCGDRVEVFVQRDTTGGIADCGFEAHGCAISIASADLMAELLPGHSTGEALRIAGAVQRMVETGEQEHAALSTLRPLSGVHEYPSRRRCATLPWQALVQALEQAA